MFYQFARSLSIESLHSKHVSLSIRNKIYYFDYVWLHDHDPCNVDSITNQKISLPISFSKPKLSVENHQLIVKWEKHQSSFTEKWLLKHQYTYPTSCNEFSSLSVLYPADYKSICMDYNQLDSNLLDLLVNIYQYGICFIKNTPPTKLATSRIANRIAFIRPTHFGTLWDFTADYKHKDSAYSNASLAVHTDTTYFTDPIRLQLFHVLKFNGKGGSSTYADGYKAISNLSKFSFKLLSSVSLKAHCTGDSNVKILSRFPVIQSLSSHNVVRWNPDDRSPLDYDVSAQLSAVNATMTDYYAALDEYQQILNKITWSAELKPGLAVIVDNHRFLHGRRAFVGQRHVCGAYINGDDYLSKLRTELNK
eukprot:NODE_67_length_23829_cov_0.557059.p7 type:complete len:364 gc:universal NODE_67_length_23829_cov_0.557059:22903-21812(-)